MCHCLESLCFLELATPPFLVGVTFYFSENESAGTRSDSSVSDMVWHWSTTTILAPNQFLHTSIYVISKLY